MHYKKDGSLDMRYASSKAAVSRGSSSRVPTTSYSSPGYGSGLHYKKDGSLDMRYSSSRAASNSMGYSAPGSATGLHYKKDGTLDMRYSSSKQAASTSASSYSHPSSQLHYKKDGTLDMRYSSSKEVVNSGLSAEIKRMHIAPSSIPLTKAGYPDMRTKAAREYVAAMAQRGAEDGVKLPRRKDGRLDTSSAAVQCYLHNRTAQPVQRSRTQYYNDLLVQNNDFLEAFLRLLQENPVQMPPAAPVMIIEGGMSARDTHNAVRRTIPGDIHELSQQDMTELIASGREIGRGGFGTVFRCTWRHKDVAVKSLHLQQLTRQEKPAFIRELQVLARLGRHPNLTRLLAYSFEPPAFVMKFITLGSLHHNLYYNENNDVVARLCMSTTKKEILYGIINGMITLHANGIIHGDLKPANILLNARMIPKITDFGLSHFRSRVSSTAQSVDAENEGERGVMGTAAYMAPELLNMEHRIQTSADVYAFGILMNELATEEEPYADRFHLFQGRGPFAAAHYAALGNRPTMHVEDPQYGTFATITTLCWAADTAERPTFVQLQQLINTPEFIVPCLVPIANNNVAVQAGVPGVSAATDRII